MVKPPLSNIAAPLREYVERIEKLADEKSDISSAISDIYREVKSAGLDIKTTREMVKLRKMDSAKRAEQEFNRDVYLRALGLADDIA